MLLTRLVSHSVLTSVLLYFLASIAFAQVQGRHQHILFWGGLRGGLALALALGLPPDVPHGETIISVSFVVVSFSIFVQGLTMPPLLRRMGEMPLANNEQNSRRNDS